MLSCRIVDDVLLMRDILLNVCQYVLENRGENHVWNQIPLILCSGYSKMEKDSYGDEEGQCLLYAGCPEGPPVMWWPRCACPPSSLFLVLLWGRALFAGLLLQSPFGWRWEKRKELRNYVHLSCSTPPAYAMRSNTYLDHVICRVIYMTTSACLIGHAPVVSLSKSHSKEWLGPLLWNTHFRVVSLEKGLR